MCWNYNIITLFICNKVQVLNSFFETNNVFNNLKSKQLKAQNVYEAFFLLDNSFN